MVGDEKIKNINESQIEKNSKHFLNEFSKNNFLIKTAHA